MCYWVIIRRSAVLSNYFSKVSTQLKGRSNSSTRHNTRFYGSRTQRGRNQSIYYWERQTVWHFDPSLCHLYYCCSYLFIFGQRWIRLNVYVGVTENKFKICLWLAQRIFRKLKTWNIKHRLCIRKWSIFILWIPQKFPQKQRKKSKHET